MPPRARRLLLVGAAVAAAAVALAAAILLSQRSARVPLAGMVRQIEVRVAPEVTGRLGTIAVQPGQAVRKGDLLAVLDNPELAASLGEGRAAAASAKAERDRIYSGVRAEQVAMLDEAVRTAEANLLLAEQENVRASALAARDFASRQKLDESDALLAKSRADLELKRSQLGAARAGPTAEERALADARVILAEARVATLQAALDKTRLVAPVDGTVGVLVARRGEVVPVGKPVLTLVTGQKWFAFTVREDGLRGIEPGATLALAANDGRRIEARVTELRPLGEFATWRAARAVGDHDLNSFRLRLEPLAGADELQPGMTVWLAGR
jgi:HlyD family secretion protein